MADQASFDFGDATIQERFLRFHDAHPEVYDALVRFTREAISGTRRNRIGIRMIWERMRWYFFIERGADFKLNDHFHSRYARLIMRRESDLQGVFELRQLKAK